MSSKIEYPGVIFSVESDIVRVKILQKTACADCHAKSMCNLSEVKEKILEIPHQNQVFELGDEILVVGAPSMGMKAVFWAFILPMLLMLALLFCGTYFLKSEIIGALLSVAILIVYYIALYFQRDRLKKEFVFSLKNI